MPDGLRASKTVGGTTTRYVYDGQNVVAEKNGSGVITASYCIGKTGVVSRTDYTSGTATSTVFFLYDGGANLDSVVNESGELVKQFDYDVFGAARAVRPTGQSAEKTGFAGGIGHMTDAEAGLIYMRARYYDPSTGRFISQDPGENGTNWYLYCDANPTNYVDESGEFKLDVDTLYQHGQYRYRLDAAGDLHVWWRKGKAAIYASGEYRHFSGQQVPRTFMKFLRENTDFFTKVGNAGDDLLRGMASFGALTTVDAYARQDPVGFMEIMGDIYGFGDGWSD